MTRAVFKFRDAVWSRRVRRSLAVALVGALPAIAAAQTTAPSLLEQLSGETQKLHRQVSASLVHLRLPRHENSAAPIDELFRKWEPRLEPEVKQKLQEQLSQTRPGSDDDVFSLLRSGETGSNVLLMRPFENGSISPQALQILMVPRHHREAPRALGVVIDGRGLVLVPAFVDRELAGAGLRLSLSGGEQVDAAFLGSDRQTNVTLLRLNKPSTPAAALAQSRPADGSLVMVFSPHHDVARLAVWTGGGHENGIVVMPDGRIAGFANGGQFLAAAAATPIVQQLEQHGHVKRATLGVRVSEVRPDDPLRQQLPSLGQQPAMRVDRVFAESAADKSGLRAGDLILSVANQSVGDLPTFAAAIAARQGVTAMRVLRGGRVITVNVELARK